MKAVLFSVLLMNQLGELPSSRVTVHQPGRTLKELRTHLGWASLIEPELNRKLLEQRFELFEFVPWDLEQLRALGVDLQEPMTFWIDASDTIVMRATFRKRKAKEAFSVLSKRLSSTKGSWRFSDGRGRAFDVGGSIPVAVYKDDRQLYFQLPRPARMSLFRLGDSDEPQGSRPGRRGQGLAKDRRFRPLHDALTSGEPRRKRKRGDPHLSVHIEGGRMFSSADGDIVLAAGRIDAELDLRLSLTAELAVSEVFSKKLRAKRLLSHPADQPIALEAFGRVTKEGARLIATEVFGLDNEASVVLSGAFHAIVSEDGGGFFVVDRAQKPLAPFRKALASRGMTVEPDRAASSLTVTMHHPPSAELLPAGKPSDSRAALEVIADPPKLLDALTSLSASRRPPRLNSTKVLAVKLALGDAMKKTSLARVSAIPRPPNLALSIRLEHPEVPW